MEVVRTVEQNQTGNRQHKWRLGKAWRWGLALAVVGCISFVVILQILVSRAEPILKGRVIETLSTRFNSRVELGQLHVSVASGLNVTGSGLRIFAPEEEVAAGATAPLFEVDQFEFRAGFLGLMFKPTHIGTVLVRGLKIDIPPKEVRQHGGWSSRHLGKVKIVVDRIVCDDSRLTIGTNKPNKDPKVFLLKHIVLRNVGPQSPWLFDAMLTNAVPRGEIHATGKFGPWATQDPGDSKVNGDYQFDHADLNTIKGIAGILKSTGSFDGKLDQIAVRGTTEMSDFSLDMANHPMPLWTRFDAIVDGTSGDTYLQHIDAKLGGSEFSCEGAVIGVKGRGHDIRLKVDIPSGHMEDFLRLTVKSDPPPLSALAAVKATLFIRAGHESVSKKMTMKGNFALRKIHFTDPEVEDKVDTMSLRASGKTKDLKPGAPDVTSRMTGDFDMANGQLAFSRLNYSLPGGEVQLKGTYSMSARTYDFAGTVKTNAAISQMVASKWKSILLKPIDPFFRKNGSGAEIPIHISGSKGKPKVGLRLK